MRYGISTRDMASRLNEAGVIDIQQINSPDGERIYNFRHKDQTVVLRNRDARGYFMALGRHYALFYA